MKIAVFSAKPYDIEFLNKNNSYGYEFSFFETKLNLKTATLAKGHDGICAFVNDLLDASVLNQLKNQNNNFVVLRCAGFNNVDIKVAKELGIQVARVPKYSPEAVAEHTIGLMLTLSRKYHKAYHRVRDNNFNLDGLLGFNLSGKTVGIIGTGAIGLATIKPLLGFGMKVLCYDPIPNEKIKDLATYTTLDEIYEKSDIISLHCPLTPETYHLINPASIAKMKGGVMIINTSRGALIDTTAIISALKTQKIGSLGIDVYEQEADLFFEDLSNKIIQDDEFQRLLTFPNVLITGHQAFFTKEALEVISQTTLQNIKDICDNRLKSSNFLC
jgi:D-lactate dehydrogenase